MLDNETINKLKALIDANPDKVELTAALDDVARVIANQSFLISALNDMLMTYQDNDDELNAIANKYDLQGMLSNLPEPKRNDFSVKDAVVASNSLVEKVKSATDFTDILKSVVQVAKVFI